MQLYVNIEIINMRILYQITLSYACAGIIVLNNVVIESAPIFNWMIGKNMVDICIWLAKKRGKLVKVTTL